MTEHQQTLWVAVISEKLQTADNFWTQFSWSSVSAASLIDDILPEVLNQLQRDPDECGLTHVFRCAEDLPELSDCTQSTRQAEVDNLDVPRGGQAGEEDVLRLWERDAERRRGERGANSCGAGKMRCSVDRSSSALITVCSVWISTHWQRQCLPFCTFLQCEYCWRGENTLITWLVKHCYYRITAPSDERTFCTNVVYVVYDGFG